MVEDWFHRTVVKPLGEVMQAARLGETYENIPQMCSFGGPRGGWCGMCVEESGSGLRNDFSILNKEFNKRTHFKTLFLGGLY